LKKLAQRGLTWQHSSSSPSPARCHHRRHDRFALFAGIAGSSTSSFPVGEVSPDLAPRRRAEP
jgi:hypothetical protein